MPRAARRLDSFRPAVRLDRTAELSTRPTRAARSTRSARTNRSAGTARKISCHQLRLRNVVVDGAMTSRRRNSPTNSAHRTQLATEKTVPTAHVGAESVRERESSRKKKHAAGTDG